jgi:hypothetical protein
MNITYPNLKPQKWRMHHLYAAANWHTESTCVTAEHPPSSGMGKACTGSRHGSLSERLGEVVRKGGKATTALEGTTVAKAGLVRGKQVAQTWKAQQRWQLSRRWRPCQLNMAHRQTASSQLTRCSPRSLTGPTAPHPTAPRIHAPNAQVLDQG